MSRKAGGKKLHLPSYKKSLLDVIAAKGGSTSYLNMECIKSIFYMTVLANKLILLANGLSQRINKLNKYC